MMKVTFDGIKAHIALSVGAEGSVLAETVKARADKIVVHYEVESQNEPAQVAAVMRNARNGCFVRQAVDRPGLFEDTINLNGQALNLDDYPPPRR